MMLVLDQGLPRSAVTHLATLGLTSVHVGDVGMSAASDAAILAFAAMHNAVVATLDADFHALLAVSGATAPSVIRIRIERLTGQQLATLLAHVVQLAGSELAGGALVTVTPPNQVRVRRLPVV